jgi:hypothetical protein
MLVLARLLLAVIGAVATVGLGWPSASLADHIGIGGSVGASVERFGSNSWLVTVTFDAECRGAGPAGASYQGNLYLVDSETSERTFLGGISVASGRVTQLIHSTDRWRRS